MKNKIILVIGRKGCGKSYLVKKKIIPRMKPVVIVDHLSEYHGFSIYVDLEVMLDDLENGVLKSCITRFDNDEDNEILFDVCFDFSPHTLVIEEINKFCSPMSITPGLNALARYGRHKQINIIGITQRPADLPKIFTSQVDHWIIFNQTEPRDIKYLEDAIGRPLKSELQNLPLHKFKHIKMG